jgi:catechol 2,3-dioxygenase-like lactoylglutathione lyase family enzyme
MPLPTESKEVSPIRESVENISRYLPFAREAVSAYWFLLPPHLLASDNRRMRINLTSVLVDDQNKALMFYTGVLGFVKKADFAAGQFKWLTVVSPEAPHEIELLLEPNVYPPAKTFQKSLFDDGIPATTFAVDDLAEEYERLKSLGVVFRTPPTDSGPVKLALFDDTCGNLVQLVQKSA